MAKDVDQKDKAILAALRTNAKASVQEIAALTQIPATTVHQRIKRMEQLGIIRGYRVILDEAKLGIKAKAVVFINGSKQLPQQLRSLEAVTRVAAVVGEYDYLVEIAGGDLEEIHMTLRYLKRIDGVQNLHAYMVLEQY